jgi:hypothetical protein
VIEPVAARADGAAAPQNATTAATASAAEMLRKQKP